ncbi:hypothetical protein SDC9_106828 [bioreactor metagenome]|uniref:Cation efflux protein cytoplasmic domain-containing protein n=1 Tax=bioreactor metagenome TaxID=1076179 RepID=A0A645B3F0_9ZZZZ|nr:hypothetical protein [Sphaerochaeta sp.]
MGQIPVVTILIALFISKETFSIVQKTVGILMESSAPLDYEAIKSDIEAMGKVRNIHLVHSWMANENTIHFEAHVDLEYMLLSEIQAVRRSIEK